jgi:hypothetical protein
MSRDDKLAKICHGQRCYFGFPGVCCGDPAKVVPCHLRAGNVAGMGQKPPPVCCMPGCFDCHNVFDGRTKSKFSKTELYAMAFAGHQQWLAWMWRNEILIPVCARQSSRAPRSRFLG